MGRPINDPLVKQEAIRLRVEEKNSLKEVSQLLGISKSTASVWLKDYSLSAEELSGRRKSGIYRITKNNTKKTDRRWGIRNPRKTAAEKCPDPEERRVRDRVRSLRNKYGLTIEDYERLYNSQGGACKLCGTITKLVVDHCHTTKTVRGLLCSSCNSGLGKLGDSVENLELAIKYLRGELSDSEHISVNAKSEEKKKYMREYMQRKRANGEYGW